MYNLFLVWLFFLTDLIILLPTAFNTMFQVMILYIIHKIKCIFVKQFVIRLCKRRLWLKDKNPEMCKTVEATVTNVCVSDKVFVIYEISARVLWLIYVCLSLQGMIVTTLHLLQRPSHLTLQQAWHLGHQVAFTAQYK